ncbi:glycosyltransferase family 2 protein [Pontibacter sp. H249]|uniref:glycosyltransferase family 2 protein n=1 Tax=Pontibacter sp. H249 TaxID=3133420 RepID=UPI0030C08DCE
MSHSISVTILVKNSQKHLDACLGALQAFEEVIVLDNGSTDDSMAIASRYANVKVFSSPFIGFGPLKNLAAHYASNSWILSIDSDEVLSDELKAEIRQLDLTNTEKVYSVKRNNYYRNKLIDGCGWDNDFVQRLYNKDVTHFEDLQVHEYVRTEGLQVQRLRGTIAHFSYDSISQLIAKSDKYTSLFAAEKRFVKKSSAFKSYYKWAFSFFRSYVLQRGFMLGYEGLTISFTNAAYSFYKYMKLHEANQTLNMSMVIAQSLDSRAWESIKTTLLVQQEVLQELIVPEPDFGIKSVKVSNSFCRVSTYSVTPEKNSITILRDAVQATIGEYIILLNNAAELPTDFLKKIKRDARKGHYTFRKTNNGVYELITFWKKDLLELDISEAPAGGDSVDFASLAALLQQQNLKSVSMA